MNALSQFLRPVLRSEARNDERSKLEQFQGSTSDSFRETVLSSFKLRSLDLSIKDFDQVEGKKHLAEGILTGDSILVILQGFLQPESTLQVSDTAESLLLMMPKEGPRLQDQIFLLASKIDDLVDQIPYNHPSLIKLARLVEELATAEKTFVYRHLKDGSRLAVSLDQFTMTLIDSFPNAPPDHDARAFVNWNAFVAILYAHSVWLTCPLFAVKTMHTVFEEEIDPQYSTEVMVMGAAQWIIWYGQGIYMQILWHDEADEDSIRPLSYGPLFHGNTSKRLTRQRWDFWKEGFRGAAERDDYGAEGRSVARGAAKMMAAIEEAMDF